MERVINTDNCMVCGIQLNYSRNELTMLLNFSQKPIYSLIEEFTDTSFSDDIVRDAAVCDECFIKFNEYDEYQKLASQIQQEVSSLFFSHINQVKDDDLSFKAEHEDLVYETLESFNDNQIDDVNTEMIISHEIEEPEEIDVEVAVIDKKNLPRKFQTFQSGDKHQIVKARAVKSDSYTIVQLDNNIRLYQCEICNRTFKEKSKLKAHREIHTTERNVFCPTCGKSFKTAACLRSHKRVHNPTIIECDFCGKTYTQKAELVKHINFVHFNRRDYECMVCKASFGCKGHLKAHVVTHQEHRGIRCGICGFTFHTKAKLDRHMKSHTGERDYECGICGKRFLYSYNVSAHIRHVHWKEKRKSDDRPKTCNLCNVRFSTHAKLREHLEKDHQLMEDDTVIIEEDEDPGLIQYVEENDFEHIEA